MGSEHDVIVLGLGGIGSGAAYWLAKRGARVLGVEQFELGHARGESHDHTRIIRLSYHAPQYVQLANEAYAAWSAVEADSGARLVHKVGGLDLGPQDGAIPLEGYADAMSACGVPFEWLDASEIRREFPQFHVAEDVRGLFQADGGFVAAERATAAHQLLAERFGARLLGRAPVRAIQSTGHEIVVTLESGEHYSARSLVIAAGPWSARALGWFDVSIPLEVTKEQAMYFVPRDLREFDPSAFPVWIWMDDPSFYGFPVFGEPAVKVTQDAGGKAVDPDTRGFDPDSDITQRVREFVAHVLPGALGPEHLVKTCLYTLTPDRDFVIDTLAEHPNVHVAIGAGHAFKFASVIGRILSDLAIDGRTNSGIEHFAIDRGILRMQAPPKTYMV
ncbi:MAG TPA: N-methyl-L-tryptophan oxidase [Candidatus Baltobacteraceae bacterium]|nr:N-methyl-L-tryptophan oxidase [Candidatus Baltobacteraceae bacterium]